MGGNWGEKGDGLQAWMEEKTSTRVISWVCEKKKNWQSKRRGRGKTKVTAGQTFTWAISCALSHTCCNGFTVTTCTNPVMTRSFVSTTVKDGFTSGCITSLKAATINSRWCLCFNNLWCFSKTLYLTYLKKTSLTFSSYDIEVQPATCLGNGMIFPHKETIVLINIV